MTHPISLFAAATVLLTGSAIAQLPKGTAAPSFDFDKVWNDGPGEFSELDGKLIILDFAQTW
jgi:hypothetical protein